MTFKQRMLSLFSENKRQRKKTSSKPRRRRRSEVLIKNSFRNVLKNKFLFFNLVLLIIMSAFIYTSLSISYVRVLDNFNNLNQTSHLHDFIGDFRSSQAYNNTDQKQNPSGKSNEPNPTSIEYPQYTLHNLNHYLQKKYHAPTESFFNYNRVETRNFKLNNNDLFTKTVAYSPYQTIDKLVPGVSPGQTGYYNPQLLDKPVLGPNGIKWWLGALINKEFAEDNNIHIGDIIRLQPDQYGKDIKVADDANTALQNTLNANAQKPLENWLPESPYSTLGWFQVRGYGLSADLTSPIIDNTTPIPNKEKNGIIYVDYHNFGLEHKQEQYQYGSDMLTQPFYHYNKPKDKAYIDSNLDKDTYYVGTFNNHTNTGWDNLTSGQKEALMNQFLHNPPPDYKTTHHYVTNNNKPIIYNLNDSGYKYYGRTAFLMTTLNAFTTYVAFLLIFLVTLTILGLVFVIRKTVTKERKQLGFLKAMGYRSWPIMLSFLAFPIVVAFLGGLIGYLIGLFIQNSFIGIFTNYFNINYGSFTFSWLSLFFSLVILFAVLSAVTLITVGVMLRMRVVEMMRGTSKRDLKVRWVTRKLNNSVRHASFDNRFRMTIFTSSFGRMTTVFFTVMIGTFLLTTAVMGHKIMEDNLSDYNKGQNYNTKTLYNSPVWNLPTTFYKTYDPQTKYISNNPHDPNASFNNNETKMWEDAYKGTMGTQYYAENPQMFQSDFLHQDLSNLDWRALSKSGLEALNNAQIGKGNPRDFASQIGFEQLFFSVGRAWPDAKDLFSKLDYNPNPLLTPPLTQPSLLPYAGLSLGTLSKLSETVYPSYSINDWAEAQAKKTGSTVTKVEQQAYSALRAFYIKYTSTINLHVASSVYQNKPSDSSTLKWGQLDHRDADKTSNVLDHFLLNQKVQPLQNGDLYDDDGAHADLDNIDLHDWNTSYQAVLANPNFAFLYHNRLYGKTLDAAHPYSADNSDRQVINTQKYNQKLFTQMLDWFNLEFNGQEQQFIIQGSYSQEPYFAQQYIAKAFADPNKDYAVTFNIAPYDPNQDLLGTYLRAEYHNYPFNIYGLPKANGSQFMNLRNSDHKLLNPALYQKNTHGIPIIINSSLAKKFNLQAGDTINFSNSINQFNTTNPVGEKGGISGHSPWLEKGDPINKPQSGWDQYNYNNLDMGWIFPNMKKYGPQSMSTTNIKYNSKAGVIPMYDSGSLLPTPAPSEMTQNVYMQNSTNQLVNSNHDYYVSGVSDNYGVPAAYVAQQQANHVQHYDQSANSLFRLFCHQWANDDSNLHDLLSPHATSKTDQLLAAAKATIANVVKTDVEPPDPNILDNFSAGDYAPVIVPDGFTKQEVINAVLAMFHHQYPIFNYRLSKSQTLDDVTSSANTTQPYGDFSIWGLNGGKDPTDKNVNYQLQGMGAIQNITPNSQVIQLLDQLTGIVDIVLFVFVVIALITAFSIISTSINVIIDDNRYHIANLKILGYSDFKIGLLLTGIYLPIVFVAFLVSFLGSWYGLQRVISVIAQKTSWVFPFLFAWWIPVLVLTVLLFIYVITYFGSWANLKRINPLMLLQK